MTKLLDKQLDSSQPHRRELWQQFKKLPDPISKDQAWRFASTRKYRVGDLTSTENLSKGKLCELSTRSTILDAFSGQAVLAGNQIVGSLILDDETAALGVTLNSLGENPVIEHLSNKSNDTFSGVLFKLSTSPASIIN